MSGMTVAQFFERAITWEREALAFYAKLADLFADDLSARDVWLKMAADEALHASLLEEGLTVLEEAQRSQVLTSAQVDVVESIERELAEVRGEDIVTLDDAYELANRLESSEINSVFQMLVLDTLAADARSALVKSQFEDHLARLTGLRRTFDRDARRAVAASA